MCNSKVKVTTSNSVKVGGGDNLHICVIVIVEVTDSISVEVGDTTFKYV